MSKLGEGVHDSYKERASKGGDVLWHVTIKGQNELSPGIPLHMSLKVFEDNKEMDLKEIKEKVKHFDLQTPDPKKLKFKTTIFTSDRDGTQYYMLLVGGTDKEYSDFYDSLKHCGTVYKKFMPHVTIDKGLYEKIKEEGLKPEEVSFEPLCIEAGAGNTVHEFEKSENLQDMKKGEGNMQITPNEVDTVEDVGMLNNSPVKMIRTKGGFWIAVGRPKGKYREEALAAGSHSAIVKFNLEREHPTFQPAMQKSERFTDTSVVNKHSHFLSEDLRKSGHDIYSVQNGSGIDFHITKNGANISTSKAILDSGDLVMTELKVQPQFVKALAGATVEKAINCGIKLKAE